ncbi:MAG TPA: type II toxin-antitoxin system RelE/ParE family toxin [Dyadobacter sp.]|nr:type II toxin-antitoxin system RelE/ParE family toxin [Dyadobacter sp.]
MEEDSEPRKQLIFVGRALEEIKAFPGDVMQEAGYNIDLVQCGKEPSDWKPFRGVGRGGVKEIRLWDDSGTYRVVYLVDLKDTVCVLCGFKKTSEKTEKAHTDLIKKRIKQMNEQ